MNIIEYTDKQKSLRLKQEKTRKELTALLTRYKELGQEIEDNEIIALSDGLLDVEFGKFAKKLLEKFNLPYDEKSISAHANLSNNDVKAIKANPSKKISVPVTFVIGHNRISIDGHIGADQIADKIADQSPSFLFGLVTIKNPQDIKVNSSNITLDTFSYNFGKPFNQEKFCKKLFNECLKDEVAEERAKMSAPEKPVEKDNK